MEYEIYSKTGRLLERAATIEQATAFLRRSKQASYVVKGRTVVLRKGRESNLPKPKQG